jgi:ribosomal protein L6P/L9E
VNNCVLYFAKESKDFIFTLNFKDDYFSFGCKGSLGYFYSGGIFINNVNVIKNNKLLFFNKMGYKSFLVNFKNSLYGVSYGFFTLLKLKGVGFRSWVDSFRNDLVLVIGYSHYVFYKIPRDVIIKSKKGRILIFGIDKQIVYNVASEIQSLRYPDIYKGKGIQFFGKNLTLKIGKQR